MFVSDVGDSLWQVSNLVTVMLVTSLCWWLYHGDRFQMLVAEWLCWRLFSICWLFLNVLNRSPTSWFGHQHLKLVTNTSGLQHPSPTSMQPQSNDLSGTIFRSVEFSNDRCAVNRVQKWIFRYFEYQCHLRKNELPNFQNEYLASLDWSLSLW